MGFFVPDRRHGFTLVEVLFVVSIVVLLSSVVIGNVMEGKKESHDTQRVSDLEQIQAGLRIYRDVNSSSYPVYDSGELVGDVDGVDATFSAYVTGTIRDPLSRDGYQYYYDSDYVCNTGESHVVLLALTMERSSSANYEDVCNGAPTDLGNGVTPSEDSYIVLLKKN